MTMGMPSALNFRGISNVLEYTRPSSKALSYLYRNESDVCSFTYDTNDSETPRRRGTCTKIWPSNSYLGYSTALIANKGATEYVVATSAPRENLNGVIRFFKIKPSSSGGENMFEMDPLIRGPSSGAYFGYSICAVDVNGDGLKDLIVGAPYYMEKFEYNKGAIYIYMQTAINVCIF